MLSKKAQCTTKLSCIINRLHSKVNVLIEIIYKHPKDKQIYINTIKHQQ